MPYVQIKMAHDPAKPVTEAQRRELVEGITDLLAKVADRNPANVMIEISESDASHWGLGGQLVSERRKAAAAKK